jgi:hypothetical protein
MLARLPSFGAVRLLAHRYAAEICHSDRRLQHLFADAGDLKSTFSPETRRAASPSTSAELPELVRGSPPVSKA